MPHDHARLGDDKPLTTERTQRVLVGIVLALALTAVIGLVLLWPDAERPVLAEELGMGAELVDATVTRAEQAPCFGTAEEDGIICDEVNFRVTSGGTSGDTGAFQVPVTEAAINFEDGDKITLGYQPEVEPQFQYYFNDFQRDTPLAVLVGLFVIAVVALGRWQGLRALIGLVITGAVMVGFLFPSVLDGHDPTAVALVSAVVIALTALYLTHGITERTTVALLGTFGALGVTAILAAVFSSAANFTGLSSEDAFYLQIASSSVDIKGLVLAYAGASLPLLLIYTQAGRRLTDVAAGELVAVEVVRTLVGSIGLVTAVPVTTALAAWVITRGTASGTTHEAPAPPPPVPPAPGAAEPLTSPRRRAARPDQPPAEPTPPTEPDWSQFAPNDPEDW